jgi:hypothetical protein
LDKSSENKKRQYTKKESPYDAWEDCDVCTKESWVKWIDHLRKLGKPPNFYVAEKHFKGLCLIREEEWDCDLLIDCIIDKGQGSLYVPTDWKYKLKFK